MLKSIFSRKLPINELPCWSPDKQGSYLNLKRSYGGQIVWDIRYNRYRPKIKCDFFNELKAGKIKVERQLSNLARAMSAGSVTYTGFLEAIERSERIKLRD